MIIAVILAAGSGTRFDKALPKQFYKLRGKALVEYSLDIVEALEQIDFTILVINPSHESEYKKIIGKYTKTIEICPGSTTRQGSVYNALKHMEKNCDVGEDTKVLIHDCARVFSRGVFLNVLEGLKAHWAVIPVVNVKDTVYVVKNDEVVSIPDRRELVRVQTPQGFSFFRLLQCHERAKVTGGSFSDDGSLYLTYDGKGLSLCKGEQGNFKITDKDDILLAEYSLLKKGRC